MKTVYKVVARDVMLGEPAVLVSAFATGESATLFYSDKRFTKPKIKNSLIFVFDSLDSAQEYLMDEIRSGIIDDFELWEAETDGDVYSLTERLKTVLNFESQFEEFWSRNWERSIEKYPCPKGTVGVHSLRLVKKIDLPEKD